MLKRRSFLAVAISAIGVTVLIQGLAFLRQLLIAAYFGVSRDLDVYLMSYALATMVVFTFSLTFDSAVVPRLVRARDESGDAAARALAVSLFRWSCVLGVAATSLLLALTPLLAPLMATGFDPLHKSQLADLVWYFAPWTFLCLPYYAIAAHHKAARNFNRVFGAEIAIGVVSIAVLVLFHRDIKMLPGAYGVGYGVALLSLLPGTGMVWNFRKRWATGTAGALRNVGKLYLANQTGSVASIVDRHFQSLVPAGGIAALNYSTQIVSGLMGLLTFREIYVVSLSEIERRDEKLERLIIGLLMVAVPLAGFVAIMAREIVEILFQRGHFDGAATALTTSILQIAAFGLIPAAVTNPLARMLQIVDRVGLIHVIYLSNVIFLGAFGYLFIGLWGLGVQGLAWMLLLNGIGGCAVASILVTRCGISLRWMRIGRYLLFISGASGLAILTAMAAAFPLNQSWSRLAVGAPSYWVVIGAMYLLIRDRLKTISG
jgi:putative peptidoglycan lipid II flippase